MSQINKGETFTDVSPGKTVTHTRLNDHVDNAVLTKGAITDQGALPITATDDEVIVADASDLVTDAPKRVTLTNLLPETIRQQVPVYAAGTLSGGVYAVTLAPAATAYTAGMVVRFKADTANAGAVDINVNTLGAKNIFTPDGKELQANAIVANQVVQVIYDGTQFLTLSPLGRGDTHEYAAGALSAGAYAVTLSPVPTAYYAGMVVRFKADSANAGAVDVNVNALGAKNIFKRVTLELAANDILANQLVTLVYDGTNFQIVGDERRGWDFTSTPAAFPGSTAVLTVAHGLGALPTRIRAVAVQTNASAQNSYAQNNEVELASIWENGNPAMAFAVSADATNIYVAQINNAANLGVIPRIGGAYAFGSFDEASWNIKVYASL